MSARSARRSEVGIRGAGEVLDACAWERAETTPCGLQLASVMRPAAAHRSSLPTQVRVHLTASDTIVRRAHACRAALDAFRARAPDHDAAPGSHRNRRWC